MYAYLEVDVFQAAYDYSVSWLLWEVETFPLLQALNVDHRAYKLSVQRTLVRKALDIFSRVGVDVLKRAGKLIVKPLNEGDNAAGNLEELTFLNGRCLLVILPLLSVLDNDNLFAVLENLQKLAELLVGPGISSAGCPFLPYKAKLTASTAPGACGWRYQMSDRSGSR